MTERTLPDLQDKPAVWSDWCLARLADYERAIEHYPMTNSVSHLAYDLFEALRKGEADIQTVARVSKCLSDAGLKGRVDRFSAAHADVPEKDGGTVEALANLEGRPFAEVKAELERTRAGIVFTAHPTFSMPRELYQAIADYASASNDKDRSKALKDIEKQPHRPDEDISLAGEHEDVLSAIGHAKSSVRALTRNVLDWAKKQYPEEWQELSPAPISVASWVGYDLDGRTDIHWSQTFRIRLEEKALQLETYAKQLEAIELGQAREEGNQLVKRLSGAAAYAREQGRLFASDLNDPAQITVAANKLTEEHPDRLVSLAEIRTKLSELATTVSEPEGQLELSLLRSEIRNYGLGCSRIHLRINAAQIHSALRADFGIRDGRDFDDRTTLALAAEKAKTASVRRTNVASIFLEQMTARRQMMLCAAFFKHVDADTPIRFLIAECEAPATMMGALFLARLYGVDHGLDLSPLFETPEAMERGGRFIERLLMEDEFVDYIKRRGRISIQIGFSDSGRFMGQAASNMAIERLQIVVARALVAKGISDVEVLVFNTHGESMGRGAFPGTLNERLDYLITPWTRARYAHENLPLNAESSFQGGDGFLHFGSKALADATTNAIWNWAFEQPEADRSDLYYSDLNYTWDFYRSIKDWQVALFDREDYQKTVGAFAPNLLQVTGSRKARRQSGGTVTGPRALRAIPHNAILQQLAIPANIFGGIGDTTGVEAERLLTHAHNSQRMGQILSLVRAARRLTSLPVLRAYGVLFNASFWISKAASDKDAAMSAMCHEIAEQLGDNQTFAAIGKLSNHFAADLAKLDRVLVDLHGDQKNLDRRKARRPIHALHALRQALVMKAFLLVASVPVFSGRHDMTRQGLFELAFALDFSGLADVLEEIFPADAGHSSALNGVEEEADVRVADAHGYPDIHEGVIAPLRQIERQIKEISVGISHFYDAWG
ncbi:MAG: phosphoenolpyruvate carboxylase [Hyphomonadaceae bacterium]